MAVTFFGELRFKLKPEKLDALELMLKRYTSESSLIRGLDDDLDILEICESLIEDYGFLLYICLFLNQFASSIEGSVFCYDETETEKCEYFVSDGKLVYTDYIYSDELKTEIYKGDVTIKLLNAVNPNNIEGYGIDSRIIDKLWNIYGLEDECVNTVNHAVATINNSNSAYLIIYFENEKIVFYKNKIYTYPFVPGDVRIINEDCVNSSTHLDKIKNTILFEFIDYENPDSMLRYKSNYYPFRKEIIGYGIEIKENQGTWKKACDLCINRLKSAFNDFGCNDCKPQFY